MLSDSMALAIRCLMKRVMGMTSCVEWNSGLGGAPDDVANRDFLRDQAELEEAVRDRLLGLDDLLRHRADHERSAIGGYGLHLQRHARHRGERTCHHVAM